MLTLLKLLADGAFHSGQVLGESLGVSRSAVWKQLQQLESDLDIEVHKVRGRGYRLATPIVLLDPAAIVESGMPGEWSVRTYDSIDSTNAEASRLIALGAPMPLLVVAEQQTAGRGAAWSQVGKPICRKPVLQPCAAHRWWDASVGRAQSAGRACGDECPA